MTEALTEVEKYEQTLRYVRRIERRLSAGDEVVVDLRRALYPHTHAARLLARQLEISYFDAQTILEEVERDGHVALQVLSVRIDRAARRHVLRTFGDPDDGMLGERVRSRADELRGSIIDAVRSSDSRQRRAFECASFLSTRLRRAQGSARSLARQLRRAGLLDASVPVRTASLRAELAVVFVDTDDLLRFLSATSVQLATRTRLELVEGDLTALSGQLRRVVRTPLAPAVHQEVRRRGPTAAASTNRSCQTEGVPASALTVALRILHPADRERYAEEWGAELLDLRRDQRMRHVLGLVRAAVVLRIRRS